MAQTQKALLLLAKDAGKFVLGTRAVPAPGAGEVLVKNTAVALNPIDAYIEHFGMFVDSFPAPSGFDGAGVIHEIGEGVTGWSVGDRVCVVPHAMKRVQTLRSSRVDSTSAR
jgi:NADPH:quinone reductase-like Zn-dependent oxidoreductase